MLSVFKVRSCDIYVYMTYYGFVMFSCQYNTY